MENINQHSEENENRKPSPSHSRQKNTESDDKKRTVDENGQRINWDDPEISAEENTEGSNPEISYPKNWPDHTDEKEIPDNPNVRKYYDQDPNASTIRSSNADKTFGDEYKYDEQKETKNLSGDQSGYTSPSNADDSGEEQASKNEEIEGDNESF